MARASEKRIAAENAVTLARIRAVVAVGVFLHVLPAVWARIRGQTLGLALPSPLFVATLVSQALIVAWLGRVARGTALDSERGLHHALLDTVYVTAATHALTGLVSSRAWWLLLAAPLLAFVTIRSVFFK